MNAFGLIKFFLVTLNGTLALLFVWPAVVLMMEGKHKVAAFSFFLAFLNGAAALLAWKQRQNKY